QLYGKGSVKAMQDFVAQTRWDANKWPPASGEKRRLIISTTTSYEDERPAPIELPAADPAAAAKLQDISRQRAAAGIYPVSRDGTGVKYRVLVASPDVSAKQISRLLYGSDARYLDIARNAGYEVENDRIKGFEADADPMLLGRSFEIAVDFAEERFLNGEPRKDNEKKITTTVLLNGTVIQDFEQSKKKGLQQVVYYPGGHKRIRHRPDDLILLGLDFVHFQIANIRNPGQEKWLRDRESDEFRANVLWTVLRDLPREKGEEARDLALKATDEGAVLEIITRPVLDRGPTFTPLELLRDHPLQTGIVATLLLAAVMLAFSGLLKRSRQPHLATRRLSPSGGRRRW
ncbi:MAG: hypothetical protein HY329_18855, partial [Chloroflexi bacterium]|nr:hypothetical protein [Chloroflexota bacterium]